MNKKEGYTILKWNGEYGALAVFVVKRNEDGKQSLFTPGRAKDTTWVEKDIAGIKEDWEDFGNEHVDNLEDVVF